MEKDKIIQTFSAVFAGADERDWAKVQNAMAANVLLDYSSLSGNPAATLSSEKIIETWKGFLPGFDRTHHQLSEFEVEINQAVANVHCRGKADHFIGKEAWTVEGTYDGELEVKNSNWVVTKLAFHLTRQTGNTTLPAEALKKMNFSN